MEEDPLRKLAAQLNVDADALADGDVDLDELADGGESMEAQ